jgi:hypothetical protein
MFIDKTLPNLVKPKHSMEEIKEQKESTHDWVKQ